MPHISEEEYNRHYREPNYEGGDLSSLISGFSSAVNLVKDNLSTIKNVGDTVGSLAGGVKNIYDATKSAEELKKLKAFNSTLGVLKEIKKLKEVTQTQPQTQPQAQPKNDLSEFLKQVKSGKGLKRF